jgi:GGDEF domain-containing protein
VSARLTISIGITALDRIPAASGRAVEAEAEGLLHAADLAMYEATANGRDRQVIYRQSRP